ncbi:bifunctional hydroxymethylpyrimidine kinase/phosphomethylpyrimidine kinase [Thiomicrospira sp. S5]|uniref:bifunctional hydroxymethylpyrimidine kinase/phosphomethylpyrimidine kinase n=1 Tax=Thiomicrospira sp. S5 TaxID=1803865 RepID=UPI000F8EB6A5|nr:bifunctional hydroxymethylpyrimidine kinase/phosphomethylpyrimidine kinase [Thiomicrospira sp. S5]
MRPTTPTVLTIAGSDPYGGAGIQADLKTIHALGGYGFSAITAITAQNSLGVQQVEALSAETLHHQLRALFEDVQIDAVKIGMLANAELIEVVAATLQRHPPNAVVLDTVLVSSSGHPLLAADAVSTLVEKLFPLADVITPNLPELNHLLNRAPETPVDDLVEIEKALCEMGVQAAVLKGGHSNDTDMATDILIQPNRGLNPESKPKHFSSPRVATTHTHGTGCVFSSAIATGLSQGQTLEEAVGNAKRHLTDWLRRSEALYFHYHDSSTAKRREPIDIRHV